MAGPRARNFYRASLMAIRTRAGRAALIPLSTRTASVRAECAHRQGESTRGRPAWPATGGRAVPY